MKDIYLERLLEQYKQATGVQNVDLKSESFKSEFVEWITRNQRIGLEYLELIRCIDVYPSIIFNTAEVGKGEFDSIALNNYITMITPYAPSTSKAELLIGDFEVKGAEPVFTSSINKGIILPHERFDRFITQNPYDQSCLGNWENLHNGGESNITVGVYGSTYDKDYQAKIADLNAFKEKLSGDYREEQFSMGDSFFYVVSSDRLVKKLILTRYMEEGESYTRGRGR